ncbi:hypothetical protein PGT21_024603 [Puccinia graminis f. sp. tritici]|uniref:Uncharacterized protein n=1 Tax=Puccinia graminis f. sp. tritici TaxID=56615 RepID=A0A5B0SKA1_PUCGR|nr:hypothetical protein PGT21_024603 [Puccinia graminis f. sp. tritici]KAA1137034.1 hypothetical protein PGTUg99_010445 [Puccinia graminis f. sp. tritici]
MLNWVSTKTRQGATRLALTVVILIVKMGGGQIERAVMMTDRALHNQRVGFQSARGWTCVKFALIYQPV